MLGQVEPFPVTVTLPVLPAWTPILPAGVAADIASAHDGESAVSGNSHLQSTRMCPEFAAAGEGNGTDAALVKPRLGSISS
ncbi:hypothetical protein GCM10010136_25830 [Limoniibacter endophyticus]|uniref:Uncharacterized protein n=1 Tax=Limoniibacter endophyticus TaxID=1565040 RepID=A0A8J3GGZ6_9HYPH|nr:hypothetical protein GCM10010136_25830 [Limoniibacter endophyticus]